MHEKLKRIGLGFLVLILAVVAGGALFEQWKRSRAASDFPAPGKMVDIGGRRLQIDCRGHGSPTVVFESGGDPSGPTDWNKVAAALAGTTRVCTYSRAGIMWSEPADGPRDGDAIIADLHALLKNAGETAPFVLVGWSLGGSYAVLYTGRYGTDVAGLVLVDSSHPDQIRQIEAITHQSSRLVTPVADILARLSWTGLLRALTPPKMNPVRAAFLPTSLPASQMEVASADKTFAEVAAAHNLGNRPLIVLTGMAPYSPAALQEVGMTAEQGARFKQSWKRMHDDMAAWSSAGRHELVMDASHNIPDEDPQAVIGAVNAVVVATRDGKALQP